MAKGTIEPGSVAGAGWQADGACPTTADMHFRDSILVPGDHLEQPQSAEQAAG